MSSKILRVDTRLGIWYTSRQLYVTLKYLNTEGMKMKKLILLGAVLSGLVGCSEYAAGKAQDAKEIKLCIDAGGVPIRSVLNDDQLSDCVFPPVPSL